MTREEGVAVVRGLYESFNLKDLDRFDAVAMMGASVDMRAFDRVVGLREAWQNWANAFHDGQVELLRVEPTAEGIRAEFIGRGTHTGPLVTPFGTVRPTHRRVELRFIDTYVLDEGEGKILRGKSEFDAKSLFAQLGVQPPTPPSRETGSAEVDWGY